MRIGEDGRHTVYYILSSSSNVYDAFTTLVESTLSRTFEEKKESAPAGTSSSAEEVTRETASDKDEL